MNKFDALRAAGTTTHDEPLLDGFLPYPCSTMTEEEIGCRLAWHSAWADHERALHGDPFARLSGDYAAQEALWLEWCDMAGIRIWAL